MRNFDAMKLVVCLCVIVTYVAVVCGMQSCISNDQCEEDECCISMVFIKGFCEKFGKEGDHCIPEATKTDFGDKNFFGCPCVDGLRCIPLNVTEEAGKIIHRNHQCQTPSI
uniref:U10-Liphistoxin-Lsp1a_1 n=1 Tax=Liphistius sp. SGP-2016 TaxID=1905180 RepID=A0A4Q8K847_9ARAC